MVFIPSPAIPYHVDQYIVEEWTSHCHVEGKLWLIESAHRTLEEAEGRIRVLLLPPSKVTKTVIREYVKTI